MATYDPLGVDYMCPYDVIADRVRQLETRREALRQLTKQAQELGLYELTDGPPPATR